MSLFRANHKKGMFFAADPLKSPTQICVARGTTDQDQCRAGVPGKSQRILSPLFGPCRLFYFFKTQLQIYSFCSLCADTHILKIFTLGGDVDL